MPGRPSHSRAPHVAAETPRASKPGPGQLDHLLGDEAVGQAATGVGADVDRHTRLVGRADGRVPARVQVEHVPVVVGELLLRRLGEGREVRDVDEGRHDGDALRGEGVDRVLLESGRVLDAVDAGGREVPQGLLAEAVRGDPDALLVRRGDGVGDGLSRPARGEVADLAVDPVADELDPAVAAVCLEPHVPDQLVLLDLVGVVADVAAGAGDWRPGADDLGQVLALVDPPRVAGLSRVTDEERAGSRSVIACCSASSRGTAPCGSRPTWQWASTRPGSTHPSSVCTSRAVGGGVNDTAPAMTHTSSTTSSGPTST